MFPAKKYMIAFSKSKLNNCLFCFVKTVYCLYKTHIGNIHMEMNIVEVRSAEIKTIIL